MAMHDRSQAEIRPGSLVRTHDNQRTITYRAERVDHRTRLIEGVMLDDGGSIITGFMMSFEGWESTAERSRV